MDSNLLLQSLLAAALIFIIAAVRNRLVFEIQASSLLTFGNSKAGIYLYSLFFLPGTVIHELSHWLMAEILQVPTGKFEILPELSGNKHGEERLGYVMTGKTGPVKGFLIGFAPLFTGILILLLLGYVFDALRAASAPLWQLILVIYGLIVTSNSMIVSGADRRNWPFMAILLVIFTVAFSRLGVIIPDAVFRFGSAAMPRINQALGLTIGLNLAMIGGSYTLRRVLERVTNKRITRGR